MDCWTTDEFEELEVNSEVPEDIGPKNQML